MNHKDECIRKYWLRGLTIGGIARKLGYQDGLKGARRVWDGLTRMELVSQKQMPEWGAVIGDKL